MIGSMPVLVAKVADDSDFLRLKNMVDQHDDWTLEYDKNQIKVWTKSVSNSSFNMVKVWSVFSSVDSMDLYNTLQDPEYRKEWDNHMVKGIDIGHLNCNNDVSYYAMSCPPPLRNRDFVLQRSWLDTGTEHYIINHSVCHKDYPPQKGYVRAISFFTGYLIRQLPSKSTGCEIAYVTSCDPQGILPSWLVNKCTQIFAPKYIRQLEKAATGYGNWKNVHNPDLKPWIYPEQIASPKISVDDCVPSTTELEQYPHFKDLITISIQNEELNLASHSKINHASSKADVLNEATARKSIIREERSQSDASKKEKESDTKGKKGRKSSDKK